MAKGSIGTNTSTIYYSGKQANCPKCKHSSKGATCKLYCSMFDIFNPHRETCNKYESKNKRRPKKNKSKKNTNKKYKR